MDKSLLSTLILKGYIKDVNQKSIVLNLNYNDFQVLNMEMN